MYYTVEEMLNEEPMKKVWQRNNLQETTVIINGESKWHCLRGEWEQKN